MSSFNYLSDTGVSSKSFKELLAKEKHTRATTRLNNKADRKAMNRGIYAASPVHFEEPIMPKQATLESRTLYNQNRAIQNPLKNTNLVSIPPNTVGIDKRLLEPTFNVTVSGV